MTASIPLVHRGRLHRLDENPRSGPGWRRRCKNKAPFLHRWDVTKMYTMQFPGRDLRQQMKNLKHYNHQPLAHYGLPDCLHNQDYADPGADPITVQLKWVKSSPICRILRRCG